MIFWMVCFLFLLSASPFAGTTATPQKTTSLAKKLIADHQYQAALKILLDERYQDSKASVINQMVRECQMALGLWLEPPFPGKSSTWIPLGENGQVASLNISADPDTAFARATRLITEQYFHSAKTILDVLVQQRQAKPEWIDARIALVSQMERLASMHGAIADSLMELGRLQQASLEYQQALVYRKDDSTLIQRKNRADAQILKSLQVFRASLDSLEAMNLFSQALRLILQEEASGTLENGMASRRAALVLKSEETKEKWRKLVATKISSKAFREADSVINLALRAFPADPDFLATLKARNEAENAWLTKLAADSLERAFAKAIHAGDVGNASLFQRQLQGISANEASSTSRQLQVDSLLAQAQMREKMEDILGRARKAMRESDFSEASGLLKTILAFNPSSQIAKSLLADLAALESQRKPKKNKPEPIAIEAPDTSASDESGKISEEQTTTSEENKTLMLEGIRKYREGSYDAAVVIWERLLKTDPGNIQARKYVANVKQKLERMK